MAPDDMGNQLLVEPMEEPRISVPLVDGPIVLAPQ